MLSQHVKLAPVWGSDMLGHVQVTAWDAGFPARQFPGAREVILSWPAGRPWQARGWARHWNAEFGFPALGGPPWTWTWLPDRQVIVGRPFDLRGDADGRLWLPSRIDYERDPLQVVEGRCEDGSTLTWDLKRHPHAMVGGATGSGKSKAIHTDCYHLLAADVLQALVVLDWKRKDFGVFGGRAWNPDTCTGVTLAKPDLGPNGLPETLDTMLDALESVGAELGRRIVDTEDAPEGTDPYARRLVLVAFDEALATLQMEAKPDAKDDSPTARGIRARNAARVRIEYLLQQIALLGRAYHVHLLLGASSPRKEILRGEAVAAIQHRRYIGQYQDVAEPVIMFGRDAPVSPPPWPGYGVWRVLRPDADPAEPYLYFKGYWVPTSWLDELLYDRIATADEWEAAGRPAELWLRAA